MDVDLAGAGEADGQRLRYARAGAVGHLVIIASDIFAEFYVRSSLWSRWGPGLCASHPAKES